MPDPKFRAKNGIRTMWLPIKIDSGAQKFHLGDAKILLVTEGTDSSKTINLYYEVDTASYEFYSKISLVFFVVGVAEEVPEGSMHVGSVRLRDGNVFHIYSRLEDDEESEDGVQLQAEE
ncbi:hypothetical protein SEA_RICKMORE_76 [Gordonia phage Rickmore]|uniref:DUF7352 domain-containing protein n=1 Tax=Gordonia phage Rickmore TaxID=2507854 RepID=A0A410TB80_9CAUD|nr:hypothetical protein HWC05_gp76 [Gordonia phage Rickmore]QAU06310.1 hypothetical protein SEA_RICKMORE_76 [Gordonia phage Rickmore]